jgi:hypothetical protein
MSTENSQGLRVTAGLSAFELLESATPQAAFVQLFDQASVAG